MEKYSFYIDERRKTLIRHRFEVEANSKEEAIGKMIGISSKLELRNSPEEIWSTIIEESLYDAEDMKEIVKLK